MLDTFTFVENPNSSITLSTLEEILRKLPKCPYTEFMVSRGCPPSDGWRLILPIHLKQDKYPDFVVFSAFAHTAFFIKGSF